MLQGQSRLAGVAPASITASGSLEGETIDGSLRLGDTDVPALLNALRTTGLAEMESNPLTAGTLEGAVVFTDEEPRLSWARLCGK